MKQGLLINIDGGNWAGKSTQAEIVAPIYDAMIVNEPGTTLFGEEIRKVVRLNRESDIAPLARALAHCAAHANTSRMMISPALERGENILRVRGPASIIAYQGAQGVPVSTLMEINKIAEGSLLGRAHTIILDADPVYLAERRQHEWQDYYERLGPKFHNTVRENYLAYARSLGNMAVVIDATQEPKEVTAQICDFIDSINQ